MARVGNPYASRAIREFLFVKPLDTLVVFDRLESASTAVPAEQVQKTFLAHFQQQPTIQSNSVLGLDGDQALRMTTLVPAVPSYRIINEGSSVGQYRVEADTAGSAQSHFLNVLQARDASAPDLQTQIKETSDAYEVTLTHPTKGSAVVTFRKGMESQGGSFGYAAAGAPAAVALGAGMQVQTITDAGPAWQ